VTADGRDVGSAWHAKPPGAFHAVLEAALEGVVSVLEQRPDLREGLRKLLVLERPSVASGGAAFMNVVEYARHRRVSERTIRGQLPEMTPGVHYERSGQRGRRVVIRVAEADRWHAERARERSTAVGVEELAIDEVTRRRAQVALRKRKENK
jgi:hypothetical protein